MTIHTDAIVVGSGASGAHAAVQALRSGLSVTMLDYGNDDPQTRAAVPDGTFTQLRRTDPSQRRYFLDGSEDTGQRENDRLGAHFTPPRRFIERDVAALLPIASTSFAPVQSLALGGLAAGWGAGAPAFEPFELEAAGLPVEAMRMYYDDVVREIGVSASTQDDTAPYVIQSEHVQPPADVDDNAAAILHAYRRRRDELHARRFFLGRAPLALLTRPLDDGGGVRAPNPYADMDFYSDAGGSVYRPRYTIERLRREPRFRYVSRALVHAFTETPEAVQVHFTDSSGARATTEARTLLIAAGALNSARIVLHSRNATGVHVPLLCNPMSYVLCVNAATFGRAVSDRRHSLAQLAAVFTPAHRGRDRVVGAFYSYRALLNYRLVKEMPLPVSLGLAAARLLATSLTIVGVHHPEMRTPRKWLALASDGRTLDAHYELSADERRDVARDIDGFEVCLRRLRCVPLAHFATPFGSSIHYAGTIPQRRSGDDAPCTTDERGKLAASDRVFLADSSTWRALPAKGPTLTLMANARRVAAEAAAELHARVES